MFRKERKAPNAEYLNEVEIYKKYSKLFYRKEISLREALQEADDDPIKRVLIISAYLQELRYIDYH